ncbi:hypothetical protein M408DRAFT_327095 [Serendipita vermifera MAFF 305830]|uniref:Uncharacterized protein n=1 Tax=Serendipita vermifera MAFF 305830 TaxID=933852 RepID=A0A0C3B479_SERVB|nr:hypothetical protein M408DRAFT_327095 [Serendipita vermifera MAFF 305830]
MYYMLGKPAQDHAKIFCQVYTVATYIMREFELVAATWLVMIRVRSLYAGHRWAKWLLYTTFVITHLLTAGFGAQSVAEVYSNISYLSFLRVCLSGIPTYTKLIYFFQIPFELLLLAMQLVHYWRLSRMIAPARPTPLLTALYTDGVVYFIATITVRLWAGLVVVFLDPTLWYMTVVIDLSTTSTFISRIFLHLNQVSAKSHCGNMSSVPQFDTTASVQNKPPSIPVDSWMEMETYR